MAGNLYQFPRAIAFDVGVVQPGARLTFTATNTTTPQNTYTDIALTVAHANPVVANSEGLFAPIYLDPSLPDYRVNYTDSFDVLIYQDDDVPAGQGGDSLTLTGVAPFFDIVESDAAANNTTWRVQANSEQLLIQVANDALTLFTNILTVDRIEQTVDIVNFLPTNLQHNGNTIPAITNGSFTATLTGYAVNPTGTMHYEIVGNLCTIINKTTQIASTSNANTFTMTILPAVCTPTIAVDGVCVLLDQGGVRQGGYTISALATTMTFIIQDYSANTGNMQTNLFETSGSKGLDEGWQVSYLLR